MRVRALNANGGWTFGSGRGNYLTGVAAVGQCVLTRIKSFLGDCFFDQGAGIDWFNLLGNFGNQLALDFNLRAVILNSPLVSSLTVLGVTYDSKTRLESPSYLIFTTISTSPIDTSQLFVNGLLTELGDILTTEGGDPIVI